MNDILKSLLPLFVRARSQGLWFHCAYQDLWFSPDDLAREHAAGRFIWGPENWSLRDPKERLAQLEREAVAHAAGVERFKERLRAK